MNNEAIDRLMKQSYVDIDQNNRIFSPEKFAELIVKECSERIAHNEHINWLTAANAARDLKHHFGLKD